MNKKMENMLIQYGISPKRGFLPDQDPMTLDEFPKIYTPWIEIARNLPKLLAANALRKEVKHLDVLLDAFIGQSENTTFNKLELECAMMLLSFIGHAYVWENWQAKPETALPSQIAIPWHQVATRLGRPPVLSYASYALYNWRKINRNKPIELGNIVLLQNFLGGMDEEWFILPHVTIEANAAPAITRAHEIQTYIEINDYKMLEKTLLHIFSSLTKMISVLKRVPDNCDPYIYYLRVRPYINGWKENLALPNGLVYRGVKEFGKKPQQFKGETGAQSSIVPTLDAAFGVTHKQSPLTMHLEEMKTYMPVKHRKFIESINKEGIHVENYFKSNKSSHPTLFEIYRACRNEGLYKFRKIHLDYAARFIHAQAQRSSGNSTSVGTGGTPFMKYLKKHMEETLIK
jgi:indoleamine 2,3-dioxygenase